jgi:hypothetical protein
MQYIFIFGKAVKIDDDFDIEVLFKLSPPHAALDGFTYSFECSAD